jgi:hypothetical protein
MSRQRPVTLETLRECVTRAGLAPADRASFAWRLPLFDHLVGERAAGGTSIPSARAV